MTDTASNALLPNMRCHGLPGPQDIADCPPSYDELSAILVPHGARKPHLTAIAKAVVEAYHRLVVGAQFNPQEHGKLAAWLDNVKAGFSRFAIAFVAEG